MANVVITDTEKSGWLKIEYNDLYPSVVDHRIQNQRKSDITAVDIIEFGGVECVEVMNSQSFSNYYTNDAYVEGFFLVDSINGVAPTSIDDLKNKILALL